MKIEDYAVLGDLGSAALVSRDGSIDWLCLPRFDSPACFAALLGTSENGRWLLQADEPAEITRCYRKDTLVLETTYETETGAVLVTDAMIVGAEVPTLIRQVEGLRGSVTMRMDLVIRFDYGSIVPWVTRNVWGGIRAIAGPDALRLSSTVELIGRNLRTESKFEVREKDKFPFVLTWTPSNDGAPRQIDRPEEAIDDTATFWKEWIKSCTYRGPYEEQVRRSLLALKTLIHENTGGIVAAVTTSLPETIGGSRNWDYRFCWIRDSTLTLSALLTAGYRAEAQRWEEWLLRAVAGTPSQLNLMYGLYGERRLTEIELPWLDGYEGSTPVRIGNGAYAQVQMDVFGELLGSFHVGRLKGIHTTESWKIERKIVAHIEKHWQEPDNGIWEVRGPRQQFTHSKVMAWLAVTCAIRAVEDFGLEGPAERWKDLAAEIHEEVCEQGFDKELGSFVQSYGSKNLDASLLMMAIVGFLPPDDPRICGTVEAIERHLLVDGFVRRYSEETDDGLTGKEGAFLACTFWLIDNLNMLGRRDEAVTHFERVLGICNDVGLMSEEYDPVSKRMLGNFPQAFSHISLINTAFNLQTPAVGADGDPFDGQSPA
ncbi:MAG: glycoside hydrolase family 15 protein [Acidobacteriota bacterium]